MANQGWSDQEVKLLITYATEPREELLRRLPGRKIEGIQKKARDLGFKLRRGTWTIRRLARESGYERCQIERAARALSVRRRKSYINNRGERAASNAHAAISDENADRILEYLRQEGAGELFISHHGGPTHRWSLRTTWQACRLCGTNGTSPGNRHGGQGLCVRCYQRASYKVGAQNIEAYIAEVKNDGRLHILRNAWSRYWKRCRLCRTRSKAGNHEHEAKGLCSWCYRMACRTLGPPMVEDYIAQVMAGSRQHHGRPR